MKRLTLVILVVTLWLSHAKADALLNAMLGIYPYNYEPQEKVEMIEERSDDEPDSKYGNNSEYYHDSDHGDHFSFEDYYLCQFCDTEIIYADKEEDSEE